MSLRLGVGHNHCAADYDAFGAHDVLEVHKDMAVVIDDTEMFNDKLDEWQNFYNFDRPHGSLAGQTPYERLQEKTTQATNAQL